MTRETKIGLLVGLAFIIVVGILIADYSADSMKRSPAPLYNTMENVLEGTNHPGARRTMLENPKTASEPKRLVDERRKPAPGSLFVGPPSEGTRQEPPKGDQTGQKEEGLAIKPPPGSNAEMEKPAGNVKEIVAERGDTVYRWARKHMGGGTPENVNAIFIANPQLKNRPERIVVGEKYRIPAPRAAASGNDRPRRDQTPPPATPAENKTEKPQTASTETAKVVTYKTQPGDNLWRIAVHQCGDARQVAKIRELNKLRDDAIIHPNMTLKIPAKGT